MINTAVVLKIHIHYNNPGPVVIANYATGLE
jgi:hypothetical protein